MLTPWIGGVSSLEYFLMICMNILRALFLAIFLLFVVFVPLAKGARPTDWIAGQVKATLPPLEGDPSFYQLENGEYVAIGGFKVVQGFQTQVADVYFLESTTEGWRIVRTSVLPRGVLGARAAEIDGILYVFSGHAGNLTQANQFVQGDVYRYDQSTNSFTIDSHEEPRIPGITYFMHQGDLVRFVQAYEGQKYTEPYPDHVDIYIQGIGWSEQYLEPNYSLRQIYLEVLKREPDPSGLSYWTQRYKEGVSLEKIREAFLASEEYQRQFSQSK